MILFVSDVPLHIQIVFPGDIHRVKCTSPYTEMFHIDMFTRDIYSVERTCHTDVVP